MKHPILWTRYGSDADITRPVIGVSGTITGTLSYASGVYGNGIQNCNATNYPRFNSQITSILFCLAIALIISKSLRFSLSTTSPLAVSTNLSTSVGAV